MKQSFEGWLAVAQRLRQQAEMQDRLAAERGENATRLNPGQRASLRAIAKRIVNSGIILADEVGMGKTRIAVEVCRCVTECRGRTALLVPPGLGYQWQDELQQGGLRDVPNVLRSLRGYHRAWDNPQRPWFELPAIMVSHAFTNWRFGNKSHAWRWALVPELYACWRKETEGRLPRNYLNSDILEGCSICPEVAQSISAAVPSDRKHPIHRLLDQLLEEVQWPRPLDRSEYSNYGELRVWLERCIGFGLGAFDLVIVDEAHKSRGSESGLSRLLANVVLSTDSPRTLALTATPVELCVEQWKDTLRRIGLSDTVLGPIQEAIDRYTEAVRRVRRAWRSCADARLGYMKSAAAFQNALSPYLLRRDKREDPAVRQFAMHSQQPVNSYRRESEITVETHRLSMGWRSAICAAESLSLVTRHTDDLLAKRLRLTLGNGHGIATFVDQVGSDDNERNGERKDQCNDEADTNDGLTKSAPDPAELKRRARADWWLKVLEPVVTGGSQALYDHPAILAAVEAIEQTTRAGEKVLVFGRFTRPLRALVDLVNAREMLRHVERDEAWPQAKVHGDPNEDGTDSDWGAVRAARRQLRSDVRLDLLDSKLQAGYDRESYRRERFREQLVSKIDMGLSEIGDIGLAPTRMFDAFRRSAQGATPRDAPEHRSLALVARALMEILETSYMNASPRDCAKAFCELIVAVTDRDNADDDTEIDDDEADDLWRTIEERLSDEYNRPQGGYARLMFGGTSAASRRMIQLAFNRPNSFPRVLVAQSLVGREGLNLHRACRTVVLLHPERNPGVVEQQIGRVDRVDSHWCSQLMQAIENRVPIDQLPRIEVRPVIFRGTYDEHNWQVLRTRWDDLRAQLHGIVISATESALDQEGRRIIDAICTAAPNFSPIKDGDAVDL